MKKLRLFLIVCCFMLLGLGFSGSAQAAGTKDDVQTVHAIYKTTCKMKIYKKASTSSKVTYHLSKGKRVIVSEQKGNMVRVKYGSHKGWMVLKTKEGYLLKRVVNGWVKQNGYWYYLYNGGSDVIKSNVMYRANKNIYKIKTSSNVIMVCHKNQFVCMTFYRKDGRWIPHMIAKCNIGTTENETPAGVFTIFKKLKKFEKNGYQYPYAMKFWKGCFAHSQATYLGSCKDVVIKDIPGDKTTHGCISMNNKQAKWFYKRAKVDVTKIVVVNTNFDKWKDW